MTWKRVFWWSVYAGWLCLIAEVSIDGKPIYETLLWWSYRPHLLAARIVGAVDGLLGVVTVVCLVVLAVRGATRVLRAMEGQQ